MVDFLVVSSQQDDLKLKMVSMSFCSFQYKYIFKGYLIKDNPIPFNAKRYIADRFGSCGKSDFGDSFNSKDRIRVNRFFFPLSLFLEKRLSTVKHDRHADVGVLVQGLYCSQHPICTNG